MELNEKVIAIARKAQRDEMEGAVMYGFMARREKNADNRRLLETMSADEARHSKMWQAVTHESVRPNKMKMAWRKLVTVVMGFTFVVKTMQREEQIAGDVYETLLDAVPEAAGMLADERRHEQELYNMLDEERLHYVGSMVLGLNDALVELTGALAGVTFALANTRLVALTGIITGISATLSMAASNYLAERASGSKDAFKSSLYTGVAYLVTVALLVLPYLLLPNEMFLAAFVVMIAIVLLIILFFNYYISVAKEEPFWSRFGEMAVISMSVAVISFGIGILARNVLGIDAL